MLCLFTVASLKIIQEGDFVCIVERDAFLFSCFNVLRSLLLMNKTEWILILVKQQFYVSAGRNLSLLTHARLCTRQGKQRDLYMNRDFVCRKTCAIGYIKTFITLHPLQSVLYWNAGKKDVVGGWRKP